MKTTISLYTFILAMILVLPSLIAHADQSDISTDATEDEIHRAYEIYAQNWGVKEYAVRHILTIEYEKANTALKLIKAGQPFSKVAAKYSIDPGSNKKGGELGWSLPAFFTPAFADAMVALAPKGLTSEPVRTEFGWHIIEVTQVRKPIPPPLNQVRSKLAEAIQARKSMQQTINADLEKAYAASNSECVKLSPDPSCPASEIFAGIWDFILTDEHGEQQYQFEFTKESVYTCLGYTGYQAHLISGPEENINNAAYYYDYDTQELVLLLNAGMCDFYPAFKGHVTGASFEGRYATFGISEVTKNGSVKGSFLK